MSNVKMNCSFCGTSNTKIIREKVGGMFNKTIIEKEVIDHSKRTYRCVGCGRVYCRSCLGNLGGLKIGIFSHSFKCPKCDSKVASI